MFNKLIRKSQAFINLLKENSALKKEIEMLEERLKQKKIEDENLYYQRYIALSVALEKKTPTVVGNSKKCALCGLDKRLFNIPSKVLDWLVEARV